MYSVALTNTERLLVQSNILNSEYDLYLSALKNSPKITIILNQKVSFLKGKLITSQTLDEDIVLLLEVLVH